MNSCCRLLAILLLCGLGTSARGDDGYIRCEPNRWTLGTERVEQVIALEEGRLVTKSLKNKSSGRELVPAGAVADEFSVHLDDAKEAVSSATGPWRMVRAEQKRLGHGELQLDLTVQRDTLQVTKTYVVYPGSSIIRQWVTLRNAGQKPLRVVEPSFLRATVRPGELAASDFHWMTGGENQPGSWVLKTEKLNPQKPRTFDSYEPFPAAPAQLLGDGIDAKITLAGKQIWPAQGWQFVRSAAVRAPFDVSVDVAAGDKLVFLVNMHGGIGYDTTAFDPKIAYADGESHVASQEFSGKQGLKGWQYQYLEGGRFVDMVYYPGFKQWRKEKDNATGTPFVGPGDQHPDVGQDSARVWTAPKSGRIRITGSVCNTGNGMEPGGYGYRMGTGTYAPWYALMGRDTGDGVVIGWDYFGHWSSSFGQAADGSVSAQLKVAGHKQSLAPGQSIETPKAFVGLFHGDLDDAGNEVLDWQYRYLWDYTRDALVSCDPHARPLDTTGTGWGQAGVGRTGDAGPTWKAPSARSSAWPT